MNKDERKAYYAANRDVIRARRKAYYAANRDAVLARQKAKYAANRDVMRASQKAYREANRDVVNARQKAKYAANRAARKARQRAYHAANREKNRAAKLKRAYGLTPEDYQQLLALQQECCKICNRRVKLFVDHDHETGRVRGLLCSGCNFSLGVYEKQQRPAGLVIEPYEEYLAAT